MKKFFQSVLFVASIFLLTPSVFAESTPGSQILVHGTYGIKISVPSGQWDADMFQKVDTAKAIFVVVHRDTLASARLYHYGSIPDLNEFYEDLKKQVVEKGATDKIEIVKDKDPLTVGGQPALSLTVKNPTKQWIDRYVCFQLGAMSVYFQFKFAPEKFETLRADMKAILDSAALLPPGSTNNFVENASDHIIFYHPSNQDWYQQFSEGYMYTSHLEPGTTKNDAHVNYFINREGHFNTLDEAADSFRKFHESSKNIVMWYDKGSKFTLKSGQPAYSFWFKESDDNIVRRVLVMHRGFGTAIEFMTKNEAVWNLLKKDFEEILAQHIKFN